MTASSRLRATGLLSVVASLGLALVLLLKAPWQDPHRTPPTQPRETPIVAPVPELLARVALPPPPELEQKKEIPARPPLRPQKSDPPTPEESAPETPALEEPAPEEGTSLPSLDKQNPPRAETVPEAPEKPAVTIDSTRSETVADGRALLRMLEIGKGPRIEIAWPESRRQRDQLFAAFRKCLGLEVALLAPENQLFLPDAPPGRPTALQSDRFSRFLRRPSGEMPGAERKLHQMIGTRHAVSGATPVRILPRNVDAALLGGLFQLLGGAYQPGSVIRARYRLDSDELHVEDITIDGQESAGRLGLSLSILGPCSRVMVPEYGS